LSKSDNRQLCEDHTLLEEASARNQGVELHHIGSNDEILIVKSRILFVDDKCLYLDSPVSNGRPIKMASGWNIDVYTHVLRENITFKSEVMNNNYLIQINKTTTTRGIQITRPSKIWFSQRRNDFRVSMASMTSVQVDVHNVMRDNSEMTSLVAIRAVGRLINVSTGGCAIVLPKERCRQFKSGDILWVGFVLPDIPSPLIFQSELCQIFPVLEGRAMRLGIRFNEWPTPARYLRMQHPIEKFAADAQRVMNHRIHEKKK